MKVTHVTVKEFRPFTLTVTVETLDELYNLFARLNMDISNVLAACDQHQWGAAVKKGVASDPNTLFHEITKYMPMRLSNDIP